MKRKVSHRKCRLTQPRGQLAGTFRKCKIQRSTSAKSTSGLQVYKCTSAKSGLQVQKVQNRTAPTWCRSAQTKHIAVPLNESMRVITGCVRSRHAFFLLILSGITLPETKSNDSCFKTLHQSSLSERSPTPGLHNIRPAGHMRPARSFLAARENSVAENVAKARLRIITCPFRISSTLPRNRLLRPAASYVDQFGPSSFLSCAGLL